MTIKNFKAELCPKVAAKGLEKFSKLKDFLLFVVFKDLKFCFCYVVELKKEEKNTAIKKYLAEF